MKRLLIATFLIIGSVAIFAVTDRPVKKQGCSKSQPTCCLKKQQTKPASNRNDYIFWEPVNRLMMIPVK